MDQRVMSPTLAGEELQRVLDQLRALQMPPQQTQGLMPLPPPQPQLPGHGMVFHACVLLCAFFVVLLLFMLVFCFVFG